MILALFDINFEGQTSPISSSTLPISSPMFEVQVYIWGMSYCLGKIVEHATAKWKCFHFSSTWDIFQVQAFGTKSSNFVLQFKPSKYQIFINGLHYIKAHDLYNTSILAKIELFNKIIS